MTIEKTYDPAVTEAKLYSEWEKSGAFACRPESAAAPYCIMMPPPNVTGSLHMGHGLTFTLQDVLARYQRMRGRDALWQPGTDHAGIATQMVVERKLAAQGLNRRDMGREAFLKKVWEWKAESGGTITSQLRRLGASPHWERERFTMDEGLSKAVTKVFVQLYREKLIYKDTRLVNWDPKMLTAISDLEVEQKEIKGNLWHFKYPVVDNVEIAPLTPTPLPPSQAMEGEGLDRSGIENCTQHECGGSPSPHVACDGGRGVGVRGDSDEYIVVATTRPETMLGDTAVAVHPENGKLKHLIGKNVRLPLTNRLIPIIADEYADPEKGTGAVKITPAHDFNDFEVGKRHNLPMINIFDKHACLNAEVPEKYRGLERFAARKMIVADMEELGLLDKIEPHIHTVPHGDRSGVPIEPWLSEQWYCDAKTLAEPAIKAVEEGKTQFVPQQWENTYYAWMRNIEPWCISRQLWWGHQIPAWYGPDGAVFVAETEEEAREEASRYYNNHGKHIEVTPAKASVPFASSVTKATDGTPAFAGVTSVGGKVELKRDEDVLDTWFSSALWPFSTLGWPEQTPELSRYYPTDVLVTGFDIIFFWVARMMMMGLHFMGDVPFRKVYIHALVRDEKGQKMSKTKGNVIDPLEMIDKYGCDALRFTLANMSTPGRDIKLAPARIEGNRNFATKLWNAARYCQMNECAWQDNFDPVSVRHVVNRWIVGEIKTATDKVAALLDQHRFDLASSAAYEFVWNTFCDWYLEFTKPLLCGGSIMIETRATTAWVLAQMLKILQPFMPYITEELWRQIVGNGELLMITKWPQLPDSVVHQAARDEINWVIRLISAVRATRAELNVPAGSQIPLEIKDIAPARYEWLETHRDLIQRLARLSEITLVSETPKNAAQTMLDEATLILPLAGVIDLDKERARLAKESDKWIAEIRKLEAKLSSPSFTERAPPEVVEEHQTRKSEAEAMAAKLEAARKGLG